MQKRVNKHTIDINNLSIRDNLNSAVIFDIETTGLSSSSSYIYMIGLCMPSDNNGSYSIVQYMAERKEEEALIIKAFLQDIEPYCCLIDYNGNSFDVPFIRDRCRILGIEHKLDSYEGIDIYRRIKSFKHILKLSSTTQKSIEAYLGVHRDDEYSGGELINVYYDYQKNPSYNALDILFLHNYDDCRGLLDILTILNYAEVFSGRDLSITKANINKYRDSDGFVAKELIIDCELPFPCPIKVSYNSNECFLYIRDSYLCLKVPVYTEELKFFYDNYKDYYYLPIEDMAIHKSVGIFTPREFRQQANKANCYTRKLSEYLPQWTPVFTPFYKREYKSSNLFFEITDEFKSNKDIMQTYIQHILATMMKNK